MSTSAPLDLDHLISIARAQQALGVGRTTLYALIRDKQLPVIKIGRRTLISARELQAFIENLAKQASSTNDGGRS